MGWYDVEKNCEQYIGMADGYDGRLLIELLQKHLPNGEVLELGMGPGTDFELLSEHYDVTGSDSSEVFVERYRANHPDASLRVIDAVEFDDVGGPYDAIFSNKVLYHLYPDDLKRSFEKQLHALKPGRFLIHSFWAGDPRTDEGQGLLFTYYDEESLQATLPESVEVLALERYEEDKKDDSLVLLVRK